MCVYMFKSTLKIHGGIFADRLCLEINFWWHFVLRSSECFACVYSPLNCLWFAIIPTNCNFIHVFFAWKLTLFVHSRCLFGFSNSRQIFWMFYNRCDAFRITICCSFCVKPFGVFALLMDKIEIETLKQHSLKSRFHHWQMKRLY